MQRTLIMIRHAKAVWASPLENDFDRSLSERGKNEAIDIGKRLKKLNINPDLILSSPSKRTTQTSKRIAEALDYDTGKIQYMEKLYHCIPTVFEEIMHDMVGPGVKTLVFVAHNPGITEFVNRLSHSFSIDDLPTCGVVGAHFKAAEWSTFATTYEKEVFLFEFPKI